MPLPPPPATGLIRHRVSDLVAFLLEKGRVLARAVIAWQNSNAGLRHQCLGAILKAHGADRFGRRADERDAGASTILGELRILRQEPISWVDALGVCLPRDRQNGGAER